MLSSKPPSFLFQFNGTVTWSFYHVPHSCTRKYILNKHNPLLAGLSFWVPDFKSKPQKKASFCLRVQSLRICFATVGEQLEASPQAPSQSLSFPSLTQNECHHAPNPTPGIQPDFSITLCFPKTNGFVCFCLKSYAHIVYMCVPC